MPLKARLSILILFFLFSIELHAQFMFDQFSRCQSAAFRVQGASTPTSKEIDDCKKECDPTGLDPNRHARYDAIKAYYGSCNRPAGTGAAQRCRDAEAKLNSTTTVEQAVWTACQADCDQAKLEDAAKSADYTRIGGACESKIQVTPVDNQGEFEDQGDTAADNETPEDNDTTEDATPPPVADTGTPSNALPAMLQGTGLLNPSSEFSAAQRVGNVNFVSGTGGGGGGPSDATGPGGSFQGSSSLPPMAPIDDRVKPADRPTSTAGGAGGGNGSGGGGGGMPASNMAGGPRGASPGYSGGRPSVAGAQLQKMNPNTFWAGGGASLAGGPSQRTTATAVLAKKVAEKKAKTPQYNLKGTGDSGLLRLFGTNPDGSSAVCGDTVFCSLEIRYQQIELLPNSDLKP